MLTGRAWDKVVASSAAAKLLMEIIPMAAKNLHPRATVSTIIESDRSLVMLCMRLYLSVEKHTKAKGRKSQEELSQGHTNMI